MENSYYHGVSFNDTNVDLPIWIMCDLIKLSHITHNNYIEVAEKESNVFLIFSLDISLPSRGTHNDIDIREQEDILIMVDKSEFGYKYNEPFAFSNRKDFPSDQLAHLNPMPKGCPASFCLHRGTRNEWFAEHTLLEYVERIKSWLQDAAAGTLIKLDIGDNFEIARIINPIGYNIYESPTIKGLINEARNSSIPFRYIWSEIVSNDLLFDGENKLSTKTFVIKDDKLIDANKLSIEFNSSNKDKCNIGLLLYSPAGCINNDYISYIPNNYLELTTLCESLNIDIKSAVKTYSDENCRRLKSIPIMIGIERPSNIVGTDSPIEVLSFLVGLNDCLNEHGEITDNAKVFTQTHREPITMEFARTLSMTNDNNNQTAILGAGAIGSKIVLHLAKSGYNNIDIIDNDIISPHNMIRHGLLSNNIGHNKAIALQNEIKNIYYRDLDNVNILGIDSTAEEHLELEENANKYTEIIDATAASNIQMFLSDIILPKSCRCIRTEIAHNGKLGIIKREGLDRKPRLDDINIDLIDLSIDDDLISEWLNSSLGSSPEFEDISVGVGCNSNTMKLNDDIISIHAANFSSVYKDMKYEKSGWLNLLHLGKYNTLHSRYIIVDEYANIQFTNNHSWSLRIKKSKITELHACLKSNIPNETGGVLVGKIDIKRKIVYVTRILESKTDCIKKPYLFMRDSTQIKQQLEHITKRSGGVLSYVGEWHTHPHGSNQLSSIDMQAVSDIRNSLDDVGYPTFVLLITSNELTPYLYGTKDIIQ